MSIPLELRTDLDFIFGNPAIVLWGLSSGNDRVPIPPQDDSGFREEEVPKHIMFPKDGTEPRLIVTQVPRHLPLRGFALGYFIYKTDFKTLYYGYIDLRTGTPTPVKFELTFFKGELKWYLGSCFYPAQYDIVGQPIDQSFISNAVVIFNDLFYKDYSNEHITMKKQLANLGENLEDFKRTVPKVYANIFREELPEQGAGSQAGILSRARNYFTRTPSTEETEQPEQPEETEVRSKNTLYSDDEDDEEEPEEPGSQAGILSRAASGAANFTSGIRNYFTGSPSKKKRKQKQNEIHISRKMKMMKKNHLIMVVKEKHDAKQSIPRVSIPRVSIPRVSISKQSIPRVSIPRVSISKQSIPQKSLIVNK